MRNTILAAMFILISFTGAFADTKPAPPVTELTVKLERPVNNLTPVMRFDLMDHGPIQVSPGLAWNLWKPTKDVVEKLQLNYNLTTKQPNVEFNTKFNL